MDLRFREEDLPALWFLHRSAATERTAFFAAVPDGKGALDVIDFLVPDQEGTPSHVECTDDGDFQLLEWVAGKRRDLGADWVLCWWHTHPGMGTSPSGTDSKVTDRWLECGEAVAMLISDPSRGLSGISAGAYARLHERIVGRFGAVVGGCPLKPVLPDGFAPKLTKAGSSGDWFGARDWKLLDPEGDAPKPKEPPPSKDDEFLWNCDGCGNVLALTDMVETSDGDVLCGRCAFDCDECGWPARASDGHDVDGKAVCDDCWAERIADGMKEERDD